MSKDLILKETSIIHKKKGEICIGDLFMDRDGVYPVVGFKERQYTDSEEKLHIIKIVIVSNHKWSDHNDGIYEITESTLDEYYTVVKGYTFDDIEELSGKILSGELSIEELSLKEEKQDPTSTALVVLNKDVFTSKLAEIKNMENRIALIQSLVRQKVDAVQQKIRGVVAEFSKVISRLNKVIFTLELYAGVQEDIRQIQSGNPADDSEPIYLNQLMRYMDEEVGDPSNEGISFDSIDKFDNWLLSYSRHLKCFYYELLLPQKKCVRILRVRRYAKESYTQDSYNNQWQILKEMQTYILIRNGENIYCIESKMNFNSKLYPDEKELNEIFEKNNEEQIFDALSSYKNGLILMQGLVDRTTVFGQVTGKISFLNTDSQEKGDVVFQYEMSEDRQITDGKETLLDFMNKFPIEVGVRILIWDTGRYHSLGEYGRGESRFTREYISHYTSPYLPEDGIYKLVEHKSVNHKDGTLKFMYEAEKQWSPKTDMKTGWMVEPNDQNVVDIDSISHRNIDWINNMLYDRKVRKNYVKVMGALQMVKKFKNEELKKEEPFVKMMISFSKKTELEVLDAVHWWKTKNKYKRPLKEDDKKAFRMINKYLNPKK
jgi:hypothetical protein